MSKSAGVRKDHELRIRQPFGLSVITSWWQPLAVWPDGNPGAEVQPGLPSLQASMEAGLPAVDYYFIGLREEEAWKRILSLGPEKKAGDVFRSIAQSHAGYDGTAGMIRRAFWAVPESNTAPRGYTKVVALATHQKEISQSPATWMCDDDDSKPLWKLWWRRRSSAGRSCPLLPLQAALVVASALGARVVEIVCGLRVHPDMNHAGRFTWADVTNPLPMDHPDERPFDPFEILVDNLFALATFILTKLPCGEPRHEAGRPPVTLALEIEPGSTYILNSIGAYHDIRERFNKRVSERVNELKDNPDARSCFQFFNDKKARRTDEDWRRFEELYRLCLGLNLDVGHMFLLGVKPEQVSAYTWQAGLKRIGRRRGGSLTSEIVHYHLSDHRSAHYSDLPPGTHHANVDFEGWIRQAYALAQLSGRPDPITHPNLTRFMAIELEASMLGHDQVSSSYARVNSWIRHCMVSSLSLGGHGFPGIQ